MRAPANTPTFIFIAPLPPPPPPPSIPPVWEHVIDVLMKLPSTTAEGQKMNTQDWTLYNMNHSLLPSRDTTQPNSLISLKPNSIRHLIMLRKYIHHLVQDSHISVSSDATDHALEPGNFLHTTFHQFMSWKLNEITISSPPPHPHSLPLTPVLLPPPLLVPLNF